jgi:hypothetical protein
MRFAVAMLTIASLGATLAVARPGEKTKNAQETTTSTDTASKKQNKKKAKKHSTDKAGATQPETK